MPRRCVVGGCLRTNAYGLWLHQWPNDEIVAELWTQFVRTTRIFYKPTKWSHICSAHFTKDCYVKSGLAVSVGMQLRLKADAVPTVRPKPMDVFLRVSKGSGENVEVSNSRSLSTPDVYPQPTSPLNVLAATAAIRSPLPLPPLFESFYELNGLHQPTSQLDVLAATAATQPSVAPSSDSLSILGWGPQAPSPLDVLAATAATQPSVAPPSDSLSTLGWCPQAPSPLDVLAATAATQPSVAPSSDSLSILGWGPQAPSPLDVLAATAATQPLVAPSSDSLSTLGWCPQAPSPLAVLAATQPPVAPSSHSRSTLGWGPQAPSPLDVIAAIAATQPPVAPSTDSRSTFDRRPQPLCPIDISNTTTVTQSPKRPFSTVSLQPTPLHILPDGISSTFPPQVVPSDINVAEMDVSEDDQEDCKIPIVYIPRPITTSTPKRRTMQEFGGGDNCSRLSPTILTCEHPSMASKLTKMHIPRKKCAVRSRGVQVRHPKKKPETCPKKVLMVSKGTQCELLTERTEDNSSEEDLDSDRDAGEAMDCDPDYVPQSDSDQDTSFEGAAPGVPCDDLPHKQKVFLVYEGPLLQLFRCCPACLNLCKTEIQRTWGSSITIAQRCPECDFSRVWHSQPKIGNIPAGNLLLSSATLFSGSSISKVLLFLQHLRVPSISEPTFHQHQKFYLQPAVTNMWRTEEDKVAADISKSGGSIHAAGDGRADSPGHSAQYGSYTILDTQLNKVVHLELVTVTEVKSSNAMEKEGLIRAISAVEKKGLNIEELTTDGHISIKKHLREEKSEIKHSLDVWHVAKGVRKKVEQLGKQKNCGRVNGWRKSLVNHVYWVASSTPSADPDLLEAKWLSVTNHIQNIHQHETDVFPTCAHQPLTGRDRKKKWMIPNEADTEKLVDILTKKTLLKDVRMLSTGQQTFSLESYHSVVNHFAPKMLHFSYQGMKIRLMLSALHFNENAGRQQALTKDGVPRYKIDRPKYKKGDHIVKKVLCPRTFDYVEKLKEEVFRLAQKGEKAAPIKDDPPPMCFSYPKPEKTQVVMAHKSRFPNNRIQ